MNKTANLPLKGVGLPAQESELSRYIREINAIPMLSLAEENQLVKEFNEAGSLLAAQKLVTSHLRLVVKIALSYRNYGLSLMDMISEGNIGLMRAVKKFDLKRGFRLSTYAIWWIKAYIQEYILQSWSLVKIGTTVTQKKLFFNLAKIKKKLGAYDQKSLTEDNVKAVSNHLGVSQREVKNMESRLNSADLYLSEKVGSNDEEGSELINYLVSDEPSQEWLIAEAQEVKQRKARLNLAFSQLKERELAIIKARKLSDKPKTNKIAIFAIFY